MIDTLHAGGAERMAVNISNGLAEQGVEVHLCVTRQTGILENFVSSDIKLFFLNKKHSFDVLALFRLIRYIYSHRIDMIHAHSTSLYYAVFAKILTITKVVWHDHNGSLDNRNRTVLYIFSLFINFTIVVNDSIKAWCIQNLKIDPKNIAYLPNFPVFYSKLTEKIDLQGDETKRIICVANFVKPKNHTTLIEAFRIVHTQVPDAHLFLVGKNYQDDYYQEVVHYIDKYQLSSNIHLLGLRADTDVLLKSCAIGVMSSVWEGLPVSLLEYGLAGLAVVCTDVGQCAEVLDGGKAGIVVTPNNVPELANSLVKLLQSSEYREILANKLYNRVTQQYSKNSFLHTLTNTYQNLLKNDSALSV